MCFRVNHRCDFGILRGRGKGACGGAAETEAQEGDGEEGLEETEGRFRLDIHGRLLEDVGLNALHPAAELLLMRFLI